MHLKMKSISCCIVLYIYDDLRRAMIVKSERRDIGFRTLTETEKLTFILKNMKRQCAKFIFNLMYRRKSVLYRLLLIFELFLCLKKTLKKSSANKY